MSLRIPLVWVFCLTSLGWSAPDPARWVPARWDGGPLELARRAKDKTFAANAGVRDAINRWYETSTLDLLHETPINCLLVTFSTGAPSEAETLQHRLVKEYALAARKRGIAVLGLVYPGAIASTVADAAIEAQLDGLVLDGEFPADFRTGLGNYPGIIIAIAQDASAVRTASAPLLAVQGVRPSARDLADMGIRAGASAEPWIDSNIWLVRSFRFGTDWRPIWISQEPNPASEGDYIRCVADAAVAGGRWIVALDDDFRTNLFRKNADALGAWRRIGTYLNFAEDHAEWRRFTPFGNLAIIIDSAADLDEYLNLIARRQVPYRLMQRSEVTAASLAGFKAVADFIPPNEAERNILREFAAKGGVVVAGPSWGGAPKDDSYAEVPLGQGRVVVYKDEPPDSESVAKDLQDLLQPGVMGLSVFNVPSAITYASTTDGGRRVLIQLLNYAGRPAERVTIRFNGIFKQARLYTPENAPQDLVARETQNGRTEVLIPKVAAWGAVLLEQRN
jgi:hypothetical protein